VNDGLLRGVADAVRLLASGDLEVYSIVWLSLRVSGAATLLATLGGLPVAVAVAAGEFRGKRLVITLFNTLMGVPTVVVGLLAYSLFSHRGSLGVFDLLFTPTGMILAEALLGWPLLVALGIAAVESADPRIRPTARGLGASRIRTSLTLISETRIAIVAAVAATFGRLISELGVAILVGGNIRGATRTMTTAIALETSRGDFRLAFALGVVLLVLALLVNLTLSLLRRA
jgi:tungstate transport system permease protein